MTRPTRIKGGWEARLRVGPGTRERFRLPDMSDDAAQARYDRLVRMRDRLVECGLTGEAPAFLKTAAAATDADFALIEEQVEKDCAERGQSKPAQLRTFRDACDAWLAGDFHKRFPDRVAPLSNDARAQARARLVHICKSIGDRPLSKLTKAACEAALAALPDGLMPYTRAQYARLIPRVLGLAELGGHIARSPLPPRWAPRRGARRDYQLLKPSEDRALMRCRSVPWEWRIFWGFLVRTGLRLSEALRLVGADVDLDTGNIVIRKTKTGRQRRFRLEDDVVRALGVHQKRLGWGAKDRLFPHRRAGMPKRLREHLASCHLVRRELHETTDESRNLTTHDLRGSAVTIWLMEGKPLPWIMARTGHRKTAMLDEYLRASEVYRGEDLGSYDDLHDLVFGPPKRAPKPGLARAERAENKLRNAVALSRADSGIGTEAERNRTNLAESAGPTDPEKHSGPPHGETSGPGKTKGGEERAPAVTGHAEVGSHAVSGSNPPTTVVAPSPPADPVERALAFALEEATKAQRWDVVLEVTRELQRRQVASKPEPGVTSLDAHRRKNGDKP